MVVVAAALFSSVSWLLIVLTQLPALGSFKQMFLFSSSTDLLKDGKRFCFRSFKESS
jgi:hypothetical protein